MKRSVALLAIALIVLSAVSVTETVFAKDHVTAYRVTITNITRGQIISPPIVISHTRNFKLFELGEPAPPGLDALAEDGDPMPLADNLAGMDSVFKISVADGGIMPGAMATIDIETRRGFRFISAAGMLVSSNDAFFAIRRAYARAWGNTFVEARAYDSGSEDNSEDCAFIPGPPCGNGGVRDTAGAEGYVYVHSGIHGTGDLDPAEHDWQNPVATVRIERVR